MSAAAAPLIAPLLSICMIVKNEEKNLARALASTTGLDAELVVADTGSTDGTVEVALRAGARVVTFPWVDDFSAARNFCFASARGRWLLVLDADEELTEGLRSEIARVLEASHAGALRLPVCNVDDRGALRMRAPSVRLVRSGRGYAYEGRVHESIESSVTRAGDEIEDVEARDRPSRLHADRGRAEAAPRSEHAPRGGRARGGKGRAASLALSRPPARDRRRSRGGGALVRARPRGAPGPRAGRLVGQPARVDPPLRALARRGLGGGAGRGGRQARTRRLAAHAGRDHAARRRRTLRARLREHALQAACARRRRLRAAERGDGDPPGACHGGRRQCPSGVCAPRSSREEAASRRGARRRAR